MLKRRLINLSIVLLLWACGVHAATIGQDTFTDTSGTNLEDHTCTPGGSCGAGTWTVENAGIIDISTGNNAFSTNATTQMARKGDDIGDDEMDCSVTARLNTVSGSRRAGVCARMSASAPFDGFCAFLILDVVDGNIDVNLTKEVGGTITQLGSQYEGNFATSDIVTLKIKIRNGTQAVDVNAVTDAITASETDATLAGNNHCGIILNSNNTNTIYVDTFHSESIDAPPATRRIITISKSFQEE